MPNDSCSMVHVLVTHAAVFPSFDILTSLKPPKGSGLVNFPIGTSASTDSVCIFMVSLLC